MGVCRRALLEAAALLVGVWPCGGGPSLGGGLSLEADQHVSRSLAHEMDGCSNGPDDLAWLGAWRSKATVDGYERIWYTYVRIDAE